MTQAARAARTASSGTSASAPVRRPYTGTASAMHRSRIVHRVTGGWDHARATASQAARIHAGAPRPTMRADLHTHTLCSDGALSPAQLMADAAAAGVELLSITDHDTLEAWQSLPPIPPGLRLVSGLELSTRWRRAGIHVVGLGVDPAAPTLAAGVAAQRAARQERARRIGARLAKLGFGDCYGAACALAEGRPVGRPHFARALVEAGHVADFAQAFRKYLGNGKAGDVKSLWVGMDEAIGWIRDAGGVAVLAHPAKYKLTRMRLNALVSDFAAAGGEAIEVVSGRQTADVTATLAALAHRHGMQASTGSDFHHPDVRWAALGRQTPLPAACTPVWSRWQATATGTIGL